MVEYKAYLKLRIPKRDNPMGLSWENYNVLACDYEFFQDVSKNGEANSRIKGGMIRLSLSDLPTDELMFWVFDHAKYYNGEISIIDVDGETLEQVYFEEARCVGFNLHYGADTKYSAETRMTLIAQRIQIGEAHFENKGI